LGDFISAYFKTGILTHITHLLVVTEKEIKKAYNVNLKKRKPEIF